MNKKEKENAEIERLAGIYRTKSDEQLLYLHEDVMSPHADKNYKKAYNTVLKERGLKPE